MLAVWIHDVVQHVSMTLKSVSPFWTRSLINSFRCLMKPESISDGNSGSAALVQWPLSLQHLENMYLGNGGMTIQGLSPLAFSTGSTFSTNFLKVVGGL
jgi:hypothetical protein